MSKQPIIIKEKNLTGKTNVLYISFKREREQANHCCHSLYPTSHYFCRVGPWHQKKINIFRSRGSPYLVFAYIIIGRTFCIVWCICTCYGGNFRLHATLLTLTHSVHHMYRLWPYTICTGMIKWLLFQFCQQMPSQGSRVLCSTWELWKGHWNLWAGTTYCSILIFCVGMCVSDWRVLSKFQSKFLLVHNQVMNIL